MPIHFSVDKSEKYFVSTYTGTVTDKELLKGYGEFLREGPWRPGMAELADFRLVDLTEISSAGMQALMEQVAEFLKEQKSEMVTAICAPRDLPYGLARMYQAYAEESPESVRVFREIEEARAWLEGR